MESLLMDFDIPACGKANESNGRQMNLTENLLGYMPPTAREMIELIGLEATFVVIKRWGGTSIYIPLRLDNETPLVQAIGMDAARKLAWHYRTDERRGGTLSIPLARRALQRMRDLEILDCIDAGDSNAQVALKFDTSDRNVRLIKARHRVGSDLKTGVKT